MNTERLFIALALPEAVRQSVASLAEPAAQINWTRPELLHVTMRFLGPVPPELCERIVEKLAQVNVEPFIVPVEGTGVFPPRGPPRVLWAGLGRGHPRLFQLRQQIDDAILSAGFLALDVRLFHPHVTLARCTETAEAEVARWLRRTQSFAAPPFRVRGFDLCSSKLSAAGPEHTIERSFLFD